MTTLNQPVADFTAPVTGDKETITLSELKGKNIILYFYPKDNTPGCTLEGQQFRDYHEAFTKENTIIFGISRESIKSHNNFKTKQCFPFELISDPEEKLCHQFDVLKPKKLYGKEYIGIERSTFLIDSQGVLRQEWRKVKVDGHIPEVLEAVKALNQ